MHRVMVVLNGVIGGANRSAADLVRSLPKETYEGCIVHPPGPTEGLQVLRAACPRTGTVYLPVWRKPNASFVRGLAQKLWGNLRSGAHLRSGWEIRRLCRKWGVELIHTNTSLTLTPALVAKALGLRHVWHIREIIGAGTPFRFPPNDRIAARAFAALSDRIVANSEQTATFFRQHLGENAITVVPNGFAEPNRDPAIAGAELRASLGIPQTAVVVGLVASLSATWKNHRHAIDAVTPLLHSRPNLFFVIYGDAPSTPYAESVRAGVQALGTQARLAGYIEDPWAIMGSIDLLVHGTPRESFGRVFVEAMLAGKPVVAPRGGGAISIVADGETGFLSDPGVANEMTSHLARLVDDNDLRQRFGEAGRARARAKFSLAAYVRAMCRVYDEVLETPRTAAE